MPSYVDYQTFADANAPEEQRMMEEAFTRAEAAGADERRALSRVKNEAAGTYASDGRVLGDTGDVTQTASYSDYLQAKKQAQQARAAVSGAENSADWRRQAVRQGVMGRSQLDERAQQMGVAAQNMESMAARGAQQGFEGRQQQQKDAAAKRQADWDAQQKRRADEEAWRTNWQRENAARQGDRPEGIAGLAQLGNLFPEARLFNYLHTGKWDFNEGLLSNQWAQGEFAKNSRPRMESNTTQDFGINDLYGEKEE